MDEITVSDGAENSSFITYLYNAAACAVAAAEGTGELQFGDRAVLRVRINRREEEIRAHLRDKIAEIIGVGYKYVFLKDRLNVCLPKREKKILCAALIAADLDGDKTYIRRKLEPCAEYSIDGFFRFRLTPLLEKWEKIVSYIPAGFASVDLKKFCEFLVGESRRKIYVKGSSVYGENFMRLRRSRLTGEEDTETEIMLADAGFVYCLGRVEDSVGDFLQKYYAERVVFS